MKYSLSRHNAFTAIDTQTLLEFTGVVIFLRMIPEEYGTYIVYVSIKSKFESTILLPIEILHFASKRRSYQ
jgi:hypothetical protein